jgi:hypothetical protein
MVAAPLDQAGYLEILDEIGHHRAIDAEPLRKRSLAVGMVLNRGSRDLSNTARSARDVIDDGGVRRLDVGAENDPQGKPEVPGGAGDPRFASSPKHWLPSDKPERRP